MTHHKADANEFELLTSHFRSMGAPNPESWARSQLDEGIPQFARYVFLHQAWKSVIAEGDTTWIEHSINSAICRPRDPGAGVGPALERILASGADPADLAEVVRVMQWEVLHSLVYQLDDPGVVTYPSDDAPRVYWRLFEVDEKGNPQHAIGGLHESVLSTEPSGREMRPKEFTRTNEK